jgi:elongator complex protein 4
MQEYDKTLNLCIANPELSKLFPTHHGLVEIHRLPSPQTLSAPSDRISELRGLRGSGENNLGFRCTRRRMVIETVHLDIEGGSSERRVVDVKKKKKKVVGFETEF